MTAADHRSQAPDAPVQSFAHCHANILKGLDGLHELPQLQQAAVRARQVARQVLDLFDGQVLEHHSEEEDQLFDAVLRSARPGAERDRVFALVQELTKEHRQLEDLWKRLRPQVQQAAEARTELVTPLLADLLAESYRAHALHEESVFLPLAVDILGRDGDHMAALGAALHLRHAQVPAGSI